MIQTVREVGSDLEGWEMNGYYIYTGLVLTVLAIFLYFKSIRIEKRKTGHYGVKSWISGFAWVLWVVAFTVCPIPLDRNIVSVEGYSDRSIMISCAIQIVAVVLTLLAFMLKASVTEVSNLRKYERGSASGL